MFVYGFLLPLYSMKMFAGNESAKNDTKEAFFIAVGDIYVRDHSETDNLHNNDVVSFTIFDTIFCSPSNGGCHIARRNEKQQTKTPQTPTIVN